MSGKDRENVQDDNKDEPNATEKARPSSNRNKSGGKSGLSRSGSHDPVALSLRQAYQDTVAENVPDEMMDLLNKLG